MSGTLTAARKALTKRRGLFILAGYSPTGFIAPAASPQSFVLPPKSPKMSKGEAARADVQATGRARLNYFNYFTEIEDAFVRRRGKHLLVSPLDWSLMESWKAAGVPLHVVLRGIERAFDSYEARPRNRSVKSLFYCQEEVEAQFAEWLESQRGASTTTTDDAATDATNTTAAGVYDESDAARDERRGLPFPP